MKPRRLVSLLIASPALAAGLWACVGDPPALSSPQNTGDASTSSPDSATSNPDGSSSNPDGSTVPDAGDAGPRCDPTKPFNAAERLKGISTGDDERAVWVSADELTAYVAVIPTNGSKSTIKKSTRASLTADFSAPTDDPQLAAINAGSVSIPSMTANGLVLMYAQSSAPVGIYVSVRNSTSENFPAGVAARTRANPFGSGDPFLAPGGESVLVARDNGVNGYEINDAPRDVGMIYGDGGYIDYAVAPDVTNVNDETADDRRPVFSPDRLTLVFASNRAPGANANTDLYISQRAGTGGTFTVATRMAEPVSSEASDLPGTISSDGCVLYFTSERAGGFGKHDVYIATRGK